MTRVKYAEFFGTINIIGTKVTATLAISNRETLGLAKHGKVRMELDNNGMLHIFADDQHAIVGVANLKCVTVDDNE